MRVWSVFFDGLCEPKNPGGVMAWGFAIDPGNGELLTGKGARPAAPANTNNVAEYFALGCALARVGELLAEPGVRETFAGLKVRGDSKLVVEQVNGSWAVKSPHLAPLHQRCLARLMETKQPWVIEWVPREQNALADKLSRDGYRELTGHEAPERWRAA